MWEATAVLSKEWEVTNWGPSAPPDKTPVLVHRKSGAIYKPGDVVDDKRLGIVTSTAIAKKYYQKHLEQWGYLEKRLLEWFIHL